MALAGLAGVGMPGWGAQGGLAGSGAQMVFLGVFGSVGLTMVVADWRTGRLADWRTGRAGRSLVRHAVRGTSAG